MLTEANIKEAIDGMFRNTHVAGILLLVLGFAVAALLKVAQGSSTVAMITTAGIMKGFVAAADSPFNLVYLATAIGSGSLIGSWMNDSGFWIVTRMSGMTEAEGLKSWTVLLLVLGVTGLLTTLVFSQILPLTAVAG
jgi:H+/gluconate symporter-like permease